MSLEPKESAPRNQVTIVYVVSEFLLSPVFSWKPRYSTSLPVKYPGINTHSKCLVDALLGTSTHPESWERLPMATLTPGNVVSPEHRDLECAFTRFTRPATQMILKLYVHRYIINMPAAEWAEINMQVSMGSLCRRV